MSNFFVSTDSTADIFVDEILSFGVGYLPLTLTIERQGDFQFVPDAFQSKQEYVDFFNTLRDAVPVKTAMNNLEIHTQYFAKLAEQGVTDCIHFTISYGLAPTRDVANQALQNLKEKYPKLNVQVVESHTTTVGQYILVKEACKWRDEGKTLAETLEHVEEMKHHIQHFVMVDDLYHLKRGGRVSGAAAAIGTLAGLKVILSFDREGKLAVVKKVMGGRRKAIKSIVDDLANFTPAKPDCHCTVVHTDNETDAKELASEIKARYDIDSEIRIMGPTIGCHVGPNAIAYVFVSENLRPQ